MSAPNLLNNPASAAEYIVYHMGLYHSVFDYETDTEPIDEPTTASKGNGHVVIKYYTDVGRTFLWVRVNGDTEWMGVELL